MCVAHTRLATRRATQPNFQKQHAQAGQTQDVHVVMCDFLPKRVTAIARAKNHTGMPWGSVGALLEIHLLYPVKVYHGKSTSNHFF